MTNRNEQYREAYLNACRVIVAGSRSFNDCVLLEQELNKLFNENEEFAGKEIKIISGMALGAVCIIIQGHYIK